MARRPPEPDAEPRRPGKAFWICVVCFVMIVAYALVALVASSEAVRIVAALVVGVAVFVPLRERVWGPDWREQLERSKQERAAKQDRARRR